FDGASWSDDARAFVETARAEGVPVALERSRSGEGGSRGRACRSGTLPVGGRGACLDLLRLAGSGARRTVAGRVAGDTHDGAASRDWLCVLRSLLSEPRHHAARR